MIYWVYGFVFYVSSCTIIALVYIHKNEKRQQELEDIKKKIHSTYDGET